MQNSDRARLKQNCCIETRMDVSQAVSPHGLDLALGPSL